MNSKARLRILLLLLFIAICLGVYLYLMTHFKVTKVEVNGSIHYSKDQIKNFVMNGKYGDNSLYLMLKYRGKPIQNIPFIERMDVHIEGPKEVSIDVYEKAIAGCVAYLDRFMYFDKDGIVVESSVDKLPGIPQVTGLVFNSCIMHERLPVENTDVFEEILEITHLLTKYGIITDRIYFGEDGRLYLFFGEAKASLGDVEHIDEKMIKLKVIIPELKGRSGTLHMENYTEDSTDTYITFEQNNPETEEKETVSANAAEEMDSSSE
ncbi:MAG: FtsQ-type POTRA domain-containing protein [Lachnospiraceae bacterium]|nr:FtsQ-type POTRA domain-containing protein [Lachnospiraceae bacterium]